MKRINAHKECGLTLVEILISVAIMAVTLPALFNGLTFVTKGMAQNRLRLQDARVIQSEVAYYKRTYEVLKTPQEGYTADEPVVEHNANGTVGLDKVTITLKRTGREISYTFYWPKKP